MKTYKVRIDWEVEVEAENKEEAIEIGFERWMDNSSSDGIYFDAKEVKVVKRQSI